MNQERVRFAIIGCGRIVKNHARPLTELPGATLVAVCDIDCDRAKAASEAYRVPMYTNYHTMLTREGIDVVNIVTPSGMHPAHVIDVIQRYQKHVVVEKPMSLAWADVASMKAVAAKYGVKIFPVYQNRYNKAIVKIRQDLLSGALGKIALATVRLRWCRPQRYYEQAPWRGTWAMDGGALTNQGIHYLDLLLYLVGDVASVYAKTATQLVNVEVEDTGVAVAAFENGTLGVIEITTASRPDDMEASISILAEKGSIVIGGIASNRLMLYSLDPAVKEAYSEDFPDAYGFGHWPFFQDVLADLRANKPHPISFDEGTRALRLLNALYRSAERNAPVRLDGDVASSRLGRPDPSLFNLYHTEPS